MDDRPLVISNILTKLYWVRLLYEFEQYKMDLQIIDDTSPKTDEASQSKQTDKKP